MKQKLLFLLTAFMLLTTGNAWADRVLYSQDYESATDASSWTSANNADGLTLQTGDATYGKYIQFYGDGVSGARTAYTNFYSTDFYRDLTTYTIEFDAAVRCSNTGSHYTELVVASDGYSLVGNDYFTNKNTTKKNYLFLLKSTGAADDTKYNINGGSTEYTIAANSWFHVKLEVNVSDKTIDYTLTGAVSATGTYTITDESSIKAKALVGTVGKGYFGTVRIDNISIRVEPISATLDHTAGAQWGNNIGESTVDANKEYYNQDQTSGWAGCAYAKFSYTIPAGHVVTSATLTYSVNQGGNYGRDDIIYYMNKDFDLNWATFAGRTGTDLRNTGSRAGKAVAAAPTGGTGDRLNLSQDVTTAVQAICEAGQNYVIFQWTGNAGGADLYGKGADAAKRPTLVIETAPPVIAAIDDCKQHETSAAFAEAIDAQSFSTGAEVYAFHTAWQIENASSNEITKVIRNAAIDATGIDWVHARIMSGQKYTGAPDDYYLDQYQATLNAYQTIYGLPAGSYKVKAATRGSAGASGNIYVYAAEQVDKNAAINLNGNTGGTLGQGWSWTEVEFTLTATSDVKIGFWCDASASEQWAGCDDFHLYRVESVTATIGATGWTTFACAYPLDLSGMSASTGDVKAYYASSVGAGKIVMTSTESKGVAAGTGLMLKGTASATVTIPVAASGDAISGNMLVGCTESTPLSTNANHYVLVNNGGTAEFQSLSAHGATIPAGKAYLNTGVISPARLIISYDEEDPTGINAVEAAEAEAGALKDGKYLIGNKVVLVKNGMKYGANGQKLN